jgi:hypothetical protein
MRLGNLSIYKEKSGIISKDSIWICIDIMGYLYTSKYLLKLLMLIITEWRQDRHLIG